MSSRLEGILAQADKLEAAGATTDQSDILYMAKVHRIMVLIIESITFSHAEEVMMRDADTGT